MVGQELAPGGFKFCGNPGRNQHAVGLFLPVGAAHAFFLKVLDFKDRTDIGIQDRVKPELHMPGAVVRLKRMVALHAGGSRMAGRHDAARGCAALEEKHAVAVLDLRVAFERPYAVGHAVFLDVGDVLSMLLQGRLDGFQISRNVFMVSFPVSRFVFPKATRHSATFQYAIRGCPKRHYLWRCSTLSSPHLDA